MRGCCVTFQIKIQVVISVRLHLQHHLLSNTRGEPHFIVGSGQQSVEVCFPVQEAEENIEKVLDVSGVLQDPQQSVVVHLCHLHVCFDLLQQPADV